MRAKDATVYTLGHPSGLPLKLAHPTIVSSDVASDRFSAMLDALGGNSGSPVMNATSQVVEGILVSGTADFVTCEQDNAGCIARLKCARSGCGLQDIARAARIRAQLKRVPKRCSHGDG